MLPPAAAPPVSGAPELAPACGVPPTALAPEGGASLGAAPPALLQASSRLSDGTKIARKLVHIAGSRATKPRSRPVEVGAPFSLEYCVAIREKERPRGGRRAVDASARQGGPAPRARRGESSSTRRALFASSSRPPRPSAERENRDEQQQAARLAASGSAGQRAAAAVVRPRLRSRFVGRSALARRFPELGRGARGARAFARSFAVAGLRVDVANDGSAQRVVFTDRDRARQLRGDVVERAVDPDQVVFGVNGRKLQVSVERSDLLRLRQLIRQRLNLLERFSVAASGRALQRAYLLRQVEQALLAPRDGSVRLAEALPEEGRDVVDALIGDESADRIVDFDVEARAHEAVVHQQALGRSEALFGAERRHLVEPAVPDASREQLVVGQLVARGSGRIVGRSPLLFEEICQLLIARLSRRLQHRGRRRTERRVGSEEERSRRGKEAVWLLVGSRQVLRGHRLHDRRFGLERGLEQGQRLRIVVG